MRVPILSFIISISIGLLACSDDEATGASNAGGSGASSDGGNNAGGNGAGGDGAGGNGFVDHGEVTSLTIDPPNATIDAELGQTESATFVATATFEDGYEAPVQATWEFDKPVLGLIDASGTVIAHGDRGGVGTVTATFDGQEATATLRVRLHYTDNPAGLSPTDIALFDTPDAQPSGTLLYPYDKTVFARGLLAPEVMWSGGAAGDVYRVHIADSTVEGTMYLSADPPSGFALADVFWRALTESNGGDDVSVQVTRMGSGQAHAPMQETWTIAQGSLRGTIHYWAVNTGQLMQIAPGASSPSITFDSGAYDQLGTPAPANYNGATPPWETGGGGKRCVACHTVSKDGGTIAAIFEKLGSTASPWGTVDLTNATPSVTQIQPYDSAAIYLALSPDGTYLVENDNAMNLRLFNAQTGAAIPSAFDGFADNMCDPAFSHDGTKIAFSSNVNGAYPVEFWRADLDIVDFDPSLGVVSNRVQVTSGANQAIAFPSFSPDSSRLFFQMGDYSRARYGAAGNLTGYNDLYVVDTAGGEPTLLANASGTTLEARNQKRSYQPTVNPIPVGGYTWVVFVSPRDYGNKMMSSTDATVDNRKQLWVAAIDNNPQPGQDPSHPAFWLGGQDLSTINMSGYWTLEACHDDGISCEQGFECCSGFCQPDGEGGYACSPPPGGCSQEGDACTSGADCCDFPQDECIGGFCAAGSPE